MSRNTSSNCRRPCRAPERPSVRDRCTADGMPVCYPAECRSAGASDLAFNSSAALSTVSRVMRLFSKCVFPNAKLRRCASFSAGVISLPGPAASNSLVTSSSSSSVALEPWCGDFGELIFHSSAFMNGVSQDRLGATGTLPRSGLASAGFKRQRGGRLQSMWLPSDKPPPQGGGSGNGL
jgi:hypothetical protein